MSLVDSNGFDEMERRTTGDGSSLYHQLTKLSDQMEGRVQWPAASLLACREAGVFGWFLPQECGGLGWTDLQVTSGYLRLSRSCLTTAFIVTQWQAACRRIMLSSNAVLRDRLAPSLAKGELFTTVGISHLTTSKQHLAVPPLRAVPTASGYRLEGSSPWVTGAAFADLLVLGATLPDQSQILAAVPTNRPGVSVRPGLPLMALSASCTGPVDLDGVSVEHAEVLAGPVENVMLASGGGTAGGLNTSVLALGLASRAMDYLLEQSQNRSTLRPMVHKLRTELEIQKDLLQKLVEGSECCSASQLRRQVNTLVLRATQAALQTAKGAGFIEGHPAGRWAREAMFFLVWSCPQAVMEANLCDFAGIEVHL